MSLEKKLNHPYVELVAQKDSLNNLLRTNPLKQPDVIIQNLFSEHGLYDFWDIPLPTNNEVLKSYRNLFPAGLQRLFPSDKEIEAVFTPDLWRALINELNIKIDHPYPQPSKERIIQARNPLFNWNYENTNAHNRVFSFMPGYTQEVRSPKIKLTNDKVKETLEFFAVRTFISELDPENTVLRFLYVLGVLDPKPGAFRERIKPYQDLVPVLKQQISKKELQKAMDTYKRAAGGVLEKADDKNHQKELCETMKEVDPENIQQHYLRKTRQKTTDLTKKDIKGFQEVYKANSLNIKPFDSEIFDDIRLWADLYLFDVPQNVRDFKSFLNVIPKKLRESLPPVDFLDAVFTDDFFAKLVPAQTTTEKNREKIETIAQIVTHATYSGDLLSAKEFLQQLHPGMTEFLRILFDVKPGGYLDSLLQASSTKTPSVQENRTQTANLLSDMNQIIKGKIKKNDLKQLAVTLTGGKTYEESALKGWIEITIPYELFESFTPPHTFLHSFRQNNGQNGKLNRTFRISSRAMTRIQQYYNLKPDDKYAKNLLQAMGFLFFKNNNPGKVQIKEFRLSERFTLTAESSFFHRLNNVYAFDLSKQLAGKNTSVPKNPTEFKQFFDQNLLPEIKQFLPDFSEIKHLFDTAFFEKFKAIKATGKMTANHNKFSVLRYCLGIDSTNIGKLLNKSLLMDPEKSQPVIPFSAIERRVRNFMKRDKDEEKVDNWQSHKKATMEKIMKIYKQDFLDWLRAHYQLTDFQESLITNVLEPKSAINKKANARPGIARLWLQIFNKLSTELVHPLRAVLSRDENIYLFSVWLQIIAQYVKNVVVDEKIGYKNTRESRQQALELYEILMESISEYAAVKSENAKKALQSFIDMEVNLDRGWFLDLWLYQKDIYKIIYKQNKKINDDYKKLNKEDLLKYLHFLFDEKTTINNTIINHVYYLLLRTNIEEDNIFQEVYNSLKRDLSNIIKDTNNKEEEEYKSILKTFIFSVNEKGFQYLKKVNLYQNAKESLYSLSGDKYKLMDEDTFYSFLLDLKTSSFTRLSLMTGETWQNYFDALYDILSNYDVPKNIEDALTKLQASLLLANAAKQRVNDLKDFSPMIKGEKNTSAWQDWEGGTINSLMDELFLRNPEMFSKWIDKIGTVLNQNEIKELHKDLLSNKKILSKKMFLFNCVGLCNHQKPLSVIEESLFIAKQSFKRFSDNLNEFNNVCKQSGVDVSKQINLLKKFYHSVLVDSKYIKFWEEEYGVKV